MHRDESDLDYICVGANKQTIITKSHKIKPLKSPFFQTALLTLIPESKNWFDRAGDPSLSPCVLVRIGNCLLDYTIKKFY